MYYIQGFEHVQGKIEFAGEHWEAWVQHKLNEPTVWRVAFGASGAARGHYEGI
jgi:hypothetical protein